MAKALQETGLNEEFVEKYQDQEKIWSGKSFMAYPDYRTLLAELPSQPWRCPPGNTGAN
jgi:hypothetical protein